MINISDLVPLENEEQAKKALIMGIQNKLQLYIIDRETGCPRLVLPSELEEIRTAPPDDRKVSIILRRDPSGIHSCQKVGYLDLWVEKEQYEISLLKNNTSETKDGNIDLEKSPNWVSLRNLIILAIKKYPSWKASRNRTDKIKKTSELKEWLVSLGADAREALFMSKVLSDFFEELK